jgi:hypothetical protein
MSRAGRLLTAALAVGIATVLAPASATRASAPVSRPALAYPPGTLIPYFCGIENHYALGLTGVVEVVDPIRG